MIGLRESMEQELQHLMQLQELLSHNNLQFPEQTLRISSSKGYPRYYICENGVYRYLKKNERALAKDLAQYHYEHRVETLLIKRIKQWKTILKDYSDLEIEELYEGESKFRKALLQPIEKTWNQRQQEWVEEAYEGKEFQPNQPVIRTERGERVRSKSEKILADYFYHKGIPYKYEKPLKLAGVGYVYPDFTFYSKKRKEEIYWEHDGRMDDPTYAVTAVKKIDSYIKNDILPGDRLIITYETARYPMQMENVEKLVRKFLL